MDAETADLNAQVGLALAGVVADAASQNAACDRPSIDVKTRIHHIGEICVRNNAMLPLERYSPFSLF